MPSKALSSTLQQHPAPTPPCPFQSIRTTLTAAPCSGGTSMPAPNAHHCGSSTLKQHLAAASSSGTPQRHQHARSKMQTCNCSCTWSKKPNSFAIWGKYWFLQIVKKCPKPLLRNDKQTGKMATCLACTASWASSNICLTMPWSWGLGRSRTWKFGASIQYLTLPRLPL